MMWLSWASRGPAMKNMCLQQGNCKHGQGTSFRLWRANPATWCSQQELRHESFSIRARHPFEGFSCNNRTVASHGRHAHTRDHLSATRSSTMQDSCNVTSEKPWAQQHCAVLRRHSLSRHSALLGIPTHTEPALPEPLLFRPSLTRHANRHQSRSHRKHPVLRPCDGNKSTPNLG